MSSVRELITPETFKSLGFRQDIPTDNWSVTVDPALKRWPQYRKAIILGICEVLSGSINYKANFKGERMRVELPPDAVVRDRLEDGYASCEFGDRTVYVRGLVTAKQWVNLRR
jgi:hypothetical protein